MPPQSDAESVAFYLAKARHWESIAQQAVSANARDAALSVARTYYTLAEVATGRQIRSAPDRPTDSQSAPRRR